MGLPLYLATFQTVLSNLTEYRTMRSQPMRAWEVMNDGNHIDTVFYASECGEIEVRNGLIEHDGYPAGIEVRLEAK